MTLAASIGWLLVVLLGLACLELRRRLELAARAEHELRGPVHAVGLVIEALARDCPDSRRADALESELGRLRIALEDLRAARTGRRSAPLVAPVPLDRLVSAAAATWDDAARRLGGEVRLDWAADAVTVEADPRRISQALSNVVANAVEHGGGEVRVEGVATPGGVRVEVRDRGPGFRRPPRSARRGGRGRGLAVAARAVKEAGGGVSVLSAESGAAVAIDFPAASELPPIDQPARGDLPATSVERYA